MRRQGPAAGRTRGPGYEEDWGLNPTLQAEKVGEPLSHPHSSVREKPVLLAGWGGGKHMAWGHLGGAMALRMCLWVMMGAEHLRAPLCSGSCLPVFPPWGCG